MAIDTYCSVFGKFHTGDRCVKPVRQESLTKLKKKWVKPEIRRYVRVESLTSEPFVKLEEVARFNKKEYQRDWMRRKRESDKANRGG